MLYVYNFIYNYIKNKYKKGDRIAKSFYVPLIFSKGSFLVSYKEYLYIKNELKYLIYLNYLLKFLLIPLILTLMLNVIIYLNCLVNILGIVKSLIKVIAFFPAYYSNSLNYSMASATCNSQNKLLSRAANNSRRFYSTTTPNNNPAVIYPNADLDKTKILLENKKKAGVYLWKNLLNNKTYVGSSTDLGRRLGFYFTISALMNHQSKSKIYSAILKYGYSNFSLEILEYCAPEDCIGREQYYMDLFKPSYNILPRAGSSLGSKRTFKPETIAKMKASKKIKNNSVIGTAAVSKPVSVTDTFTSETTVYPSRLAAEAALKAGNGSLYYVLKTQNKLYKKRYLIKNLLSEEKES